MQAMKVEWDYSELAKHYDKRADYSTVALDSIIKIMGLKSGDPIADVGAGTGKLTVPMATYGFSIMAVEPNDEMRSFGQKNASSKNVTWHRASGEETGLQDTSVRAFMMGSSFNVVDQVKCLAEASRVLQSKGWFACMWNHRDLEDETQMAIENLIKDEISDYAYGKRRMDPTEIIASSPDFEAPIHVSHRFIVSMNKDDVVDAWRSHATLQRQAKVKFHEVIDRIEGLIGHKTAIDVPYRTNIWIAKKKA